MQGNPRESAGSGKTWSQIRSGTGGAAGPLVSCRQALLDSPYQKFFHVTADFGACTKQYCVNKFGTRAGLVVERAGAILLARQYRLLVNGSSWEIPGGGVDSNETPAAAAMRECAEETGVVCAEARPLLFYHTGLDIVSSPAYLFYSTHIISEAQLPWVALQEVSGWE